MVSSNVTATSNYLTSFAGNRVQTKKTDSSSFDNILKDNVESKKVQKDNSFAKETDKNKESALGIDEHIEKVHKTDKLEKNDNVVEDRDVDAEIKKFDEAMKAIKKLKEELKNKNNENANVPFITIAINLDEQNVDEQTIKEQVILEKISEKLDIPVNELNMITDLSDEPVEIAMQLMGVDDRMDVLTNEELSTELNELTEKINEIFDEILNMSAEDINQYIVEKVSSVIEFDGQVEENIDIETEETDLFEYNTFNTKSKIVGRTLDDNVRTVSFEGKEVSRYLDKSDEKSSSSDANTNSNAFNNSYSTSVDSVAQNVAQAIEEVSSDELDSHILSQIIDNVKANAGENIKSLEMQLYPEHLGKVTIQVMSKEGVLTASIVPETETARHAIESQLVLLRDNLNEQGIKVEAIEVTVESHAFEQNLQGENRNGNEPGNRQNRRRNINFFDEDDLSIDESLEETKMEINGNTVSYKA